MKKEKQYVISGKTHTQTEYESWVSRDPKRKKAKLEKLDENVFKVKPLLEG